MGVGKALSGRSSLLPRVRHAGQLAEVVVLPGQERERPCLGFWRGQLQMHERPYPTTIAQVNNPGLKQVAVRNRYRIRDQVIDYLLHVPLHTRGRLKLRVRILDLTALEQ